MKKKTIEGIITGSIEDQFHKLPKYQKRELSKAIKIHKVGMQFKFGIITFTELKKELSEIIKEYK